MGRAKYEIIEDEESYYVEIPELKGVLAAGKTLEECRDNLETEIDILEIISQGRRNVNQRGLARIIGLYLGMTEDQESEQQQHSVHRLPVGDGGDRPAQLSLSAADHQECCLLQGGDRGLRPGAVPERVRRYPAGGGQRYGLYRGARLQHKRPALKKDAVGRGSGPPG